MREYGHGIELDRVPDPEFSKRLAHDVALLAAVENDRGQQFGARHDPCDRGKLDAFSPAARNEQYDGARAAPDELKFRTR
jgi:hypothetical protein